MDHNLERDEFVEEPPPPSPFLRPSRVPPTYPLPRWHIMASYFAPPISHVMHHAYDAALANSTDPKELVNLSLNLVIRRAAGDLRAGWCLILGTARFGTASPCLPWRKS
jgi:hypothetical protein